MMFDMFPCNTLLSSSRLSDLNKIHAAKLLALVGGAVPDFSCSRSVGYHANTEQCLSPTTIEIEITGTIALHII